MSSPRVPPHDIEAERAAIGSALLDGAICRELVEVLEPGDFYSDKHGIIWESIAAIIKQGDAPDTILIRSQLGSKLERIGGDQYLAQLTDVMPTLAQAQAYAKRVRQLAHVRRILNRCYEVAASAYTDIEDLDEWIDVAEQQLGEAPDRPGVQESVDFSAVVDAAWQAVQDQKERGSSMVGVPSGLRELDDHLRGFAPGHLVIAAGRPGMGKSAFGAGVAMGCQDNALIFSLEMDRVQWGRRAISTESRIDGHRIRGAVDLSTEDWRKMSAAAAALQETPIRFWDKPGTTIQEIKRESRRVDRELRKDGGEGLKLVLIDYLQLVEVRGEKLRSREEEVAFISKELKNLAKELGCCVLALAQLNRGVEARPNKRPFPSDLRESGAVEQDADVILFIYRDEVYNPYKVADAGERQMKDNRGIAEIIVAKNREGSIGTIEVKWTKVYTVFENLQRTSDGEPAPEDWHQ